MLIHISPEMLLAVIDLRFVTDSAIAIIVALSLGFALARVWDAGRLDTPKARCMLFVGLASILPLLVGLKALQIYEDIAVVPCTKMTQENGQLILKVVKEQRTVGLALLYGVCRRLGDASWWNLIVIIGSCFWVYTFTTGQPLAKASRKLRHRWWPIFVISTILIYYILVAAAGEVFWDRSSWTLKQKWIQVAEGTLIVLAILVGHFFAAVAIARLRALDGLPINNHITVHAAMLALLGVVSGVYVVVSDGLGRFEKVCGCAPKWKGEAPDFNVLIFQLILLFWPLVPVLINWLISCAATHKKERSDANQ